MKSWNTTYERLTAMVVPRSSVCVPNFLRVFSDLSLSFFRLIAPLHPMTTTPCSPLSFSAKCTTYSHKSAGRISMESTHLIRLRHFLTHPLSRYIIRDFQYSADQIEREREELNTADTAERELWVRSLRSHHRARRVLNKLPYRRSCFDSRKLIFQRPSKFSCTSR